MNTRYINNTFVWRDWNATYISHKFTSYLTVRAGTRQRITILCLGIRNGGGSRPGRDESALFCLL